MACFSTPHLFDATARGNPLEFLDETLITAQKVKGWGYRMVKKYRRHAQH